MARKIPATSEFGRLREVEIPAREEFTREITPENDRTFQFARTLWDRRAFLAAVMLRTALLLAVVALLLPATYESKTQLMPPDQASGAASMLTSLMGSGTSSGSSSLSGGGAGMSAGMMGMASDLLGLKTSGALFISVLKSDAVEDNIINRFDLRGEYWVSTYAQARKKLAARTDIEEEKKSGVLTLKVKDGDPARATAIAGAYVDELNQMVAGLNTSAAHRERVFLEGRLKVVKQELDQSAKDFSEFSSTHTTLDLKDQEQAMMQAAATLEGQKIAAEAELRGLEQIYTPNNVRVKSVKARIDELQHQIERVGGASSNQEPDIDKGVGLYPSIKQLPVVGVTFSDLYRRLKINESVFESLTKEYELARVQEAKEIPSVKVLVPAEHPERPSGPPRLLIFIGGVLFSLIAGCAWVLGNNAWENADPENHRKRFAEEVANEIGMKMRTSRGWQWSEQISERFRRNGKNGRNGHLAA